MSTIALAAYKEIPDYKDRDACSYNNLFIILRRSLLNSLTPQPVTKPTCQQDHILLCLTNHYYFPVSEGLFRAKWIDRFILYLGKTIRFPKQIKKLFDYFNGTATMCWVSTFKTVIPLVLP